ncbi:MAG: 3,4-dihydroxy-2-butanone 4-phosphate synthase/GTP cyclohydrolase [Candidatus Parcubacteria bacterium]|jgi:3,4-dihydroxy 2-butanone 4-phosphate synthase/GTP cyclohydrolase II
MRYNARMTSGTRKKSPRLVCTEPALIPTATGTWKAIAFYDAADKTDGSTHVVFVMGDVAGAEDLPVRVQSECMTSEVFGSLKCDCDGQLKMAMRHVRTRGRGAIVYLRQEGRGIGIFNKIRAYHLQDHGLDTVEANLKLGLPPDSREYGAAAAILRKLGVVSVRLMTNNPQKRKDLEAEGVKVTATIPLRTRPNRYNRDYLRIKKTRMGHDL